MEYYVYTYLDWNNIPFYVGKGKNDRYRISHHLDKNNTNNLLKNKIRKIGIKNIKIKFLHKNLTEKEAFQKEKYWIKYYGRRDLKLGTLCNLTDGGEGISGNVRSLELRQHLSKAVKDAWKRKGGHSEKTKRKMIKARTGMKRSEDIKQRMSEAAIERFSKSKGHSEITKQKISKGNKGRPSSLKGVPRSEETKRKISETKRKRNKNKNAIKTILNR